MPSLKTKIPASVFFFLSFFSHGVRNKWGSEISRSESVNPLTCSLRKGSDRLEHVHNASPFLCLNSSTHTRTRTLKVVRKKKTLADLRAIKVEFLEQSSIWALSNIEAAVGFSGVYMAYTVESETWQYMTLNIILSLIFAPVLHLVSHIFHIIYTQLTNGCLFTIQLSIWVCPNCTTYIVQPT